MSKRKKGKKQNKQKRKYQEALSENTARIVLDGRFLFSRQIAEQLSGNIEEFNA